MNKKYDFTEGDFLTVEDKMIDFCNLNKAEFLNFYSYLTEEEYDNTVKRLLIKLGFDK